MIVRGTIEGDAFYKAKLSELPDKADKRLLEAMRKQAKILRGIVKAKASGQVLKKQSGTLMKSIFMKTRRSRRSGKLISMVGAKAPYAHFHEFGFKTRGEREVPVKQILVPSLKQQTGQIKQAMKDALLGVVQNWDW